MGLYGGLGLGSQRYARVLRMNSRQLVRKSAVVGLAVRPGGFGKGVSRNNQQHHSFVPLRGTLRLHATEATC